MVDSETGAEHPSKELGYSGRLRDKSRTSITGSRRGICLGVVKGRESGHILGMERERKSSCISISTYKQG